MSVIQLAVDNDLSLRQFAVSDAQAVYYLISRNREHLSQHGDTTSGKYPNLDAVVNSIANPANASKLRFGIWNNPTLVGSVNLTPDEIMPCAEVGYYLGAEFQGKGYASRAVSRIVTYAFEDLKMRWVFAKVEPENTASVKVLQKNGFYLSRQEGNDTRSMIDVYTMLRA